MCQFSHLHVHTQFSLLDGAASISGLYKKAVADKMPAIAITDHGNMFGAFKFVAEAGKYNKDKTVIKPIVGCEFYLVENRHQKTFTKEQKDRRNHQLFLAKNEIGYKNLIKLCSLGYIEGYYSKYPRIDKELVLKYHEGLIATTCCIGASVPQTILKKGVAEAEKEFKWWLDIFGEDYYVEIQRHGLAEQDKVNEVLLQFAEKYNVKIIASNDSHYVDREDANAHDILLCINTGEKQSTPKAKLEEDEHSKNGRFAFENDEFYFKKTEEMKSLFQDIPQVIDNTNEIVDKVQLLNLKKDILLPAFPIPQGYESQDAYLFDITWKGAYKRYKEITHEVEERINFELFTIKSMGFAGYFLIVADFIQKGREIGVVVGPGRGSAAGSVVAYCIGITNIDPIKYNLLFERFLNPDRKSMPDIDTDFDDEGRQKVIDYVVDKYGKNQVAQIVTYGSMAAKMSIKDVARVMDLPLSESNALAKLVPERPGISLDRIIHAPLKGDKSLEEEEKLSSQEIDDAKQLRDIAEVDDLRGAVIREALVLEGSVRGTGVHAAGIIIAPDDLTNLIPVATSKDSELLLTQFEGKVIEDAGVIKMDFLGLKTLSIIRDALTLIKENHQVEIDIDTIPLDDEKTYQLYQRGETNATFQFESTGMQKYLIQLKPDKFEDLIAMNALYRPGPMSYIPNFIKRKHGMEAISYDLPEMEEFLKETYGITVYQEQVMLLSQKLANFTKGDADTLRKAMGKKDRGTLDKMKGKYLSGCEANNLNLKTCEKIWTDWEKFAQYAFNKSHSTCYAFVAYQTAYLKAHYPSEYMAAVLANATNNMDKISFFMEECKRSGIPVLGPDINESNLNFSVNKKGEIRFGLSAIKGVGEGPTIEIIAERKKRPFSSIFDITKRCNLRQVNKRVLEALAVGGAFDGFKNTHRAQYFYVEKDETIIERALRFGNDYQYNFTMNTNSLFGNDFNTEIKDPIIPTCAEWPLLDKLKKEKEAIGMYLSGHPLDENKMEMRYLVNTKLNEIAEREGEMIIGGIIQRPQIRLSKKSTEYGVFTLEDYDGSQEFMLFGEDFLKFKNYLHENLQVLIKCRKQPRYNNPNEMELKIISIETLDTVGKKYFLKLNIQIDIENVDDIFIAELDKIVLRYQGVKNLQIVVHDKQKDVSVVLFSNKNKIDINPQLIEDISKLDVAWKLN